MGISSTVVFGCWKPTFEVRLHSSDGTALRVTINLSFSSKARPLVPAISNRLLPGVSPVEVMNAPLAPLAYSR